MIKKNILAMSLWAAYVIICPGGAFAQTLPAISEECLTETPEHLYRQFLEDIPKIQEFSAHASDGPQRQAGVVPVYFTIFRNDDGSFAGREIDEALISEALARLDELFAPMNLSFVQCGQTNYVDNAGLSKFNAHRHLMDLSYVSTALNVYTRSGTGSFAQFPGNVNPNYPYANSAIGSKNNVLSLSSNSYLDATFAHEVGHSFGLVHTFEGARVYHNPEVPTPGYSGGFWDHPYGDYNNNTWRRELVLRTPDSTSAFSQPNAATAGDFVEDTPAFCKLSRNYFPNWGSPNCQSYPFNSQQCNGCIVFNCNYVGDYVDYNGQEFQDTDISVRNLMAYTGSCRQEFTPGQYERMAYYNATVRSQQYDANYCVNLQDEVSFEGTEIGIDDVLITLTHDNTYRHCNTISSTGGQFQGILYDSRARVNVLKPGSKLDPTYDDNPNDYIVPPTKVILENSYTAADWLAGLSIKDALLLHQYLMGGYPLNGYKQIAADLDNDGTVSLQDSWLLLSLLAGDLDKLPEQRSPWRFVPEYIPQLYAESFHNDPFNMTIDSVAYERFAPFLEDDWAIDIPNGMNGMNGFDGVKLGDLDGSRFSGYPLLAQFRECPEKEAGLLYSEKPLAAGQTVELGMYLGATEAISAFQMGIRLDYGLVEVIGISPGNLPGFSTDRHVGYSKERPGALKIAWVSETAAPQSMKQDEVLFRLTLKAKKALPNLQEALQLDSTLLTTEFLGEQGCTLPLKLKVDAAPSTDNPDRVPDSGQGQLNCYPNPATSQLMLSFQSKTEAHYTLFIQNAMGQAVKKAPIFIQPGWNETKLALNGLSAGLYVLSLEGPEGSFTKKFFKTED